MEGQAAADSAAGAEVLAGAAPAAGGDIMKTREFIRHCDDARIVEAIKAAIQQGQYPIDSRRIAENFLAIEKMIKE